MYLFEKSLYHTSKYRDGTAFFGKTSTLYTVQFHKLGVSSISDKKLSIVALV